MTNLLIEPEVSPFASKDDIFIAKQVQRLLDQINVLITNLLIAQDALLIE